jgi:hypothetical protein
MRLKYASQKLSPDLRLSSDAPAPDPALIALEHKQQDQRLALQIDEDQGRDALREQLERHRIGVQLEWVFIPH